MNGECYTSKCVLNFELINFVIGLNVTRIRNDSNKNVFYVNFLMLNAIPGLKYAPILCNRLSVPDVCPINLKSKFRWIMFTLHKVKHTYAHRNREAYRAKLCYVQLYTTFQISRIPSMNVNRPTMYVPENMIFRFKYIHLVWFFYPFLSYFRRIFWLSWKRPAGTETILNSNWYGPRTQYKWYLQIKAAAYSYTTVVLYFFIH